VGKKESVVRTDMEFHNDLLDRRSWSLWNNLTSQEHHPEGYDVEVVFKSTGKFTDWDSYGGFSNEAPQGWRGTAVMVFRISFWNDGNTVELFFRKEGSVSSYYDTSWDGKWERVSPKKKEVVTYEFE
jgi:hypothetical protein